MSKKIIVQDQIKMLVQQGDQWLPFYKRYVLWKRVFRNKQSIAVMDHIARILAYYEFIPTVKGIEGELRDMGYQRRDVLTVLYTFAPQENTHKIVADSLELAIFRWAGIPLNNEEAKTYCPLAIPGLVNEALDADMDGFMSRPGFSKTRKQIRENFEKGSDRIITEESVRRMLERRKRSTDANVKFSKFHGELQKWIATLTDQERLEIMLEIATMMAKKGQ